MRHLYSLAVLKLSKISKEQVNVTFHVQSDEDLWLSKVETGLSATLQSIPGKHERQQNKRAAPGDKLCGICLTYLIGQHFFLVVLKLL